MSTIYEDHPCRFRTVAGRKKPDVESAEGVADKDVWWRNPCCLKQLVKLFGEYAAGARARNWLAVTETSAIVRAYRDKLCDLRLDFAPCHVRVAESRIKNHRRIA